MWQAQSWQSPSADQQPSKLVRSKPSGPPTVMLDPAHKTYLKQNGAIRREAK